MSFQSAGVGALVALALCAPAMAAEDPFGPLTEQEKATVDRGEIVVQVEKTPTAVKHFRAIGLVKAPANKVYGAFTDYDHYADIFKLKDSKVLSRHDNVLMVRASMGLPWPIGDRWVTNETILAPESESFTYHRREGNILEYEGIVQVIPKGPQLSMVYYAAKADPGIPLLPSWLLNRFQAIILPDSIRRVREYLGVR